MTPAAQTHGLPPGSTWEAWGRWVVGMGVKRKRDYKGQVRFLLRDGSEERYHCLGGLSASGMASLLVRLHRLEVSRA